MAKWQTGWVFLPLLVMGLTVLAAAEAADAHDKVHVVGKQRAVPPAAAPVSIALGAFSDQGSGYNLHLDVSNFRFSPENIGIESSAVEGHAHLYINGRKISRIYGPWLHIPAALLEPGSNLVLVTLNDNSHRIWVQKGVRLDASIQLEGRNNDKAVRQFNLKPGATGDDITVIKAVQGQTIQLNWAASPGAAFHLHGYDLRKTAGADGRLSMTVKLAHTGRFPLVAHGKDDLLGQKETAFAYVEVRSK